MSNGAILYEGPSVLDGGPILGVLTGLERPSQNPKTGPMLQAWILRGDVDPVSAVRSGADASICGACSLRSERGFPGRRCYVNVAQGALSVWRKARERDSSSSDPRFPSSEISFLSSFSGAQVNSGAGYSRGIPDLTGRAVRLGAYGDPAAVPFSVWEELLLSADHWTGYTHQWRHPAFDARILRYCMASCDSQLDVDALLCRFPSARYFRIRRVGEEKLRDEVQCPATAQGGNAATCMLCVLCAGAAVRGRSVSIEAHGSNRAAF